MEKLEKKIEEKSKQYAATQFSDEYEEEIEVCMDSYSAGYKAGLEEVKDIAIAFAEYCKRAHLTPDAELFDSFISNYYK